MSKTFRYDAFAAGGRSVQGTLKAASQGEALRLIHDRGLLPFDAREVKDIAGPSAAAASLFGFSKALRPAEKVRFARDLATLLNADIGVDQALRILLAGTNGARPKALITRLIDSVVAGKSLSAALGAGGAGFLPDEVAMIRAGEQAGALQTTVTHLASLLARRFEMRQRIISALIYPGLLVIMSAGAVFFIIAVLVPNVLPLFEGSGAEPPAAITVLASAGTAMEAYWPMVLLGGLVVLLACRAGGKRPAFRRISGDLIMRMPVIGAFVRTAALAALARTLATLLQSGVHLQQALGAAAEAVSNETARREIREAREAVIQGRRLSNAVQQSIIFDPSAKRLLALGEESNRLPEMLSHIAADAETSLTRGLERAMVLLTPCLTLALGLSIGGLIMSVMQAILSVNEIAMR